jgi:cobalt-precorrin-5B (C1)-methyltransferase
MSGHIGQGHDPLAHPSPYGRPLPRRLVSGKLLRCGYTTGTCATAAAQAAATMLLTGGPVGSVRLETPDGTTWELEVVDPVIEAAEASCAVRKDAGDDPDATDGALIYANVTRQPWGVSIDGGPGVGRVTKAGLDQPVGAAAINSVPRRMIEQAVSAVADEAGDPTGWHVVISCPVGERIAAKTFNPRLGVVGGISILGTTGIVEPMSHAALVETMAREIAVLAADGATDLLVVIGNYGAAFARDTLGLVEGDASRLGVVKSSNFIGDAISQAAQHGIERVLVVGHVGKLAKVGIGMLNTHSSVGDGRMETLVASALEAGADAGQLRRMLDCASTDAALAVLVETGLMDATMRVLSRRVQSTFDRHVPEGVDVEWLCFMRWWGAFCDIARSSGATTLIKRWQDA